MSPSRVICLCMVSLSFLAADTSLAQAPARFPIRRETESESRTRLLRALSTSRLEGQPIGVAIPPTSIKEVFVPYASLNSWEGGLSDDAIRALFGQCAFISADELRRNSLAPWKTLTITTIGGETVQMRLMLGATLGTLALDIVGELPFRCAK